MSEQTIDLGPLADMLDPLVPTAVKNLRLELGLTLQLVDDDRQLRVIRTVTLWSQDERKRWKQIKPMFADQTWTATLTVLGEALDQLYDQRIAHKEGSDGD